MRAPLTSLIAQLVASLAAVAWALVSMLPTGTVLCLGGGHEWHQMIAPRCEHGGHHHGAARPGDSACDDHGSERSGADRHDCGEDDHPHEPAPLESDCGGCQHHERHEQSPCTDVPATDHVARVQPGERLAMPESALQPMPPPAFTSCILAATVAPRALLRACEGPPDRDAPPRVVAQSLRVVILLV